MLNVNQSGIQVGEWKFNWLIVGAVVLVITVSLVAVFRALGK